MTTTATPATAPVTLDPAQAAELGKIVAKWKDKPGSLIMVLHEVQERFGCLPRHLTLELTKLIDVPVARIYEVITFYNYFKTEAPGKYILSVCTGTACHLKGASKLTEGLGAQLGIKEGESTADKLFHLQSVRCVGCCGMAPVVMVSGAIHGKLKTDTAPAEIVAHYRAKA
jgi:NADH:ubiquinone oxidoreductase subunit E